MAVSVRSARSGTLLALCGLAILAVAHAQAAAPAPGPMADLPMSADVLLPETDGDLVTLLSHFMGVQHEIVLAQHGKDSPQAALSFAATTAQDQFTNWYLQFQNNPPVIWDMAYNFVNNFSALANATLFHISPNLAANVAFGKPAWFVNAPKIATNSKVFAAVSAAAIAVQPCLIRYGPAGVQIDPIALNISPRLIQADAAGINPSPTAISIGPLLIGVTPSGSNIGQTNVAVTPVFINVSPTVTVHPGTNKPATFARGIAIKPKPAAPTITNLAGKVVAPTTVPAASTTTASTTPVSATG